MYRSLLIAMVALISVLPAGAAQIFTATGDAGGGPVSVEADFTFSNGGFSITLKNLEANPTDVLQLISGLSFTLSGSPSSVVLSTSSAQEISITNNVGVTGSTGSTGWAFGPAVGPSYIVCVICQGVIANPAITPAHLIIGPGPYTNANGSINNNNAHNPFLNQTATFNFTGTGLTTGTTASNVIFWFGTTNGFTTSIPEPVTSGLIGTGLISLFLLRRRAQKA